MYLGCRIEHDNANGVCMGMTTPMEYAWVKSVMYLFNIWSTFLGVLTAVDVDTLGSKLLRTCIEHLVGGSVMTDAGLSA